MRNLKIKGVYRHFKGGLYIVEDIIYHSETCEKMVAYRSLTDGKLWCRPYDMFLDEVNKEGQKYRFELQILFATGNPTKATRFSKALDEKGIHVATLKDIDTEIEIEESGKNAVENAILKARAYSKVVNIPVFAMDDNLYLEGVPEEKQPGMFVRRVNGKRLSDEEMIEHYSKMVKDYGTNGKLTCRWVYGIAVIDNEKEKTYSWSKEDFYMVDTPSKKIDPGYPLNTISMNKKINKYFTDITEEEKVLLQEDESGVVDFIANSINV